MKTETIKTQGGGRYIRVTLPGTLPTYVSDTTPDLVEKKIATHFFDGLAHQGLFPRERVARHAEKHFVS